MLALAFDNTDASRPIPGSFHKFADDLVRYNYKPTKKKVKITHLGGEDNNYRKYEPGEREEDQQAAFVWFVENILAKISSTRTKFFTYRTDVLVSEIFSAEDEAWALLILINEYRVWLWDENHPASQAETDNESLQSKNNKKKPRGRAGKPKGAPRKVYTSSKSGKKNRECHGWPEEGVELYNALVKEVRKRRNTPESIVWEKQYMNKMKLDRAIINGNLTRVANPTYTDSNDESADDSDSESDEESDVDDTDARFKEAIRSAN